MEPQREEIRRLHRACRSKDAAISDTVAMANVLLRKLRDGEQLTEREYEFYEQSLKDTESYLG